MTAPEYEKREYVPTPKIREHCVHVNVDKFTMLACDPKQTKVCLDCGLEVGLDTRQRRG